jgi:uncharacterized protein YndB with AHSA1/START domain
MQDKLIAKAETSIDAPAQDVWTALTSSEGNKAFMFGADVKSDWKVGSPITWSGEFNGKAYEDKGEILEFDPGKKLSYSHFSPMSGQPDSPENYHKVTIDLSGSDAKTTRVLLEQDNNATEEAQGESEKNWKTMLSNLKKYVEESKSSSATGGAK